MVVMADDAANLRLTCSTVSIAYWRLDSRADAVGRSAQGLELGGLGHRRTAGEALTDADGGLAVHELLASKERHALGRPEGHHRVGSNGSSAARATSLSGFLRPRSPFCVAR